MLEKRFIEQDTVQSKVRFIDAPDTDDMSVDLSVRDYVVRVTNDLEDDSNGGTITINLPNVVDATGRIYSILATDIANTGSGDAGDVVVTSQGDDSNFEGDYTLTASGDRVVLYSDGFSWHALAETTT